LSLLSFKNIKIESIVSCVPKRIEKTLSYEHVSLSERELFIKTTGIQERRVANDDVTCSDLCEKAAQDILRNIDKDEIELLIFVSQSQDHFLPATAVILQEKLGLSKKCLAFDVNLGCSGYVYGLSIISGFLQNGQIKKALLMVGDKSTISTSYTDKSAYPLFGDAGTATLVSFEENYPTMHFNLQSDGSGKNSIIIEDGHSRNPYSASSDEMIDYGPGISRAKKHLKLDGFEIFNFALKEAAVNIKLLLESINKSEPDVDFFVFHQANKLINESIRKKLKVSPEKVPYSIDLFGNTSSASIPLTICHALKEEVSSPKTLLFAGFGVGYSWGSVFLETKGLQTSLIEYD
jgi:3-oxoacyl-[acyl-carrier-protein] synthase-3